MSAMSADAGRGSEGPARGSRVAASVSVGESEFVWGTRKARTAGRARSRSREPPTPGGTRAPNTLTLPLTLAARREPPEFPDKP